MKIKRVEIVGFKSFVDKVAIDFEDGIAAILGPNGCGKSNIVDAIRWAMGEQNAKNLRGRSMEDVIFGGSESRKPLGMAEVNMIFSTGAGMAPPAYREYPEIMVTRRLYRNGESEYLLNKTPCRLLDITELFMDTGIGARAYSIIEQGKIGSILNAKAEERRYLIEEAAGITKFKSRKKAALRKIEATRQNLVRLGDIISEVRRQMNSLKRQAQKAERFRNCREELKGIEIRFARDRYRELQAALECGGRQERQGRADLDGLTARLEGGELRLEELRLQQVALEKEATRGQEQVYRLSSEIQKAEGRIEFAGREIETLARQDEGLAGEVAEVHRRLVELDAEEEGLLQARQLFSADLDGGIRRLVEGEGHLGELSAGEEELDARLEAARGTLYGLLTELSQMGSLREEARRHLAAQEERASRSRSEAVAVREQMSEAEGLREELEGTLQGLRDRQAALRKEKEGLQETIRSLRRRTEEGEAALLSRREELNLHRSRLESLHQFTRDLEGYGRGVRTLLGDDAFRGRFSTIADALEVPARLEAAVEAVLGERLQALLPASREDVFKGLDFVRTGQGRCTFLVSGDRPGPEPPVKGGTPLETLVNLGPEGGGALRNLLGGVHLVEDLSPFFDAELSAGTVLVTEAGETLSWRGELAGGGRDALGQGLLRRKREIRELAARVENLGNEVATLEGRRKQFLDDQAVAEGRLSDVDSESHRRELKAVDSEKDLARLREESVRFQDRLEVLSLEESQLHEEQEALKRQLVDAERGLDDRQRQKADQEKELGRLQEEQQEMRRETELVREQVTVLKVEVASIREREEGSRQGLERLGGMRQDFRERVALLRGRQADGERDLERLRGEVESLRVNLEVLCRRREEVRGGFDRARERFEAGASRVDGEQEALKGLRGKVNDAREALSALQIKGRERQLEAEHLRQSIIERYLCDLADPPAEPEEPFDRGEAEGRLQQLRGTIEAMGEVNLTAIEEFQGLEERYQFLTSQQDDLRQSLEGLQTAISKINRTTRKRFRETFDQVNDKFREVFPRLFRGGRAELKLTDEEDLLETGIDIIAQPPGKKLQNVSLLSGGEKALTAVALIFAIFLIKPSPFCMLDEVDAPLDDANIGRFNDIVREMAKASQFIIITHNKRTMEIADTLYGVTMEEPGVSKMVSVRFNDLQG